MNALEPTSPVRGKQKADGCPAHAGHASVSELIGLESTVARQSAPAPSETLYNRLSGQATTDHVVESSSSDQPIETLPVLRSDLVLHPAQFDKGGQPKWTLHDPIRGKYYRLAWLEFELLSRWHLNDANKLLNTVNAETTLYVSRTHVDALLSMLKSNELTQARSDHDLQLLSSKQKKPDDLTVNSTLKSAFTFSMFYRKPLLNPDAFLTNTNRLLQPLYAAKKAMLVAWLCMAAIALYGVGAHWFEFRSTFTQFMTPEGFSVFALVLVLINALHEVGHGLVAKHYNCRVTEMGVALIFMLPVCYCDTSDTWRLTDNHKRLLVSAGGIVMELGIATIACLCWLVLPDGLLRTLAFFLTVTSLAATLFINLNPFMKFDGYYILADSLGVDNLQTKSFSNLRWQLRRWFTGVKEDKPYRIPESSHRLMNLYAFSTWIYRLVLYFTICWMVYQFWFKALGLLLLIGVFVTMIATPVIKESAQYVSSIKRTGINIRSGLFSMGLVAMLALLVVPLPRKVTAPAVLSSVHTSMLFATSAAQVSAVHFGLGDNITEGQKLLTLSNPEFEYQNAKLKRELATLRKRKQLETQWRASTSVTEVGEYDIAALMASLKENEEHMSSLELLASADSTVTSVPAWLTEGVWVDANTELAELASKRKIEVRAYVPAARRGLLKEGGVTFYSSTSGRRVGLDIKTIGDSSIDRLNDKALAVTNGGDIAVSKTAVGQLQPIQDWVLAVLTPADGSELEINKETSGYVLFPATAKSLLVSAFDRLYGVVIRESGF